MSSNDFLIVLMKTALAFALPTILFLLLGVLGKKGESGWTLSPSDIFKLLSKEAPPRDPGSPRWIFWLPVTYFLLALLPLSGMTYFGPVDGRPQEIVHTELGVLYVLLLLFFIPALIWPLTWSLGKTEAFLGGVRKIHQIFSFQTLLILPVVSLLFFYGEMEIHKIVQLQEGFFWEIFPRWGMFLWPMGGICFFLGLLMAYSKSSFRVFASNYEMGGGFLREFSGIHLVFFLLGEYLVMFGLVWVFAVLFLGGHSLLPGLNYLHHFFPGSLFFFQSLSLIIKITMIFMFVNFIDGKFPQFKFNQMVNFSWTVCFPLALLNFGLVLVGNFLGQNS